MNIFSILASFVVISTLFSIAAVYGVYIHFSLKEPRFISCALNSHEMSVIVQPFVMLTIFYFMYINQEMKHHLRDKLDRAGDYWNILHFRLSITIGVSAMMLFIVPMKFSVAVHGLCAGVTLTALLGYSYLTMRKVVHSILPEHEKVAGFFKLCYFDQLAISFLDVYSLMMMGVFALATVSMLFILFDILIIQREPFILQTFIEYYAHIVECDKSSTLFLNVGQALFAAAEFLALLCLAILLVHLGYILDKVYAYDERINIKND